VKLPGFRPRARAWTLSAALLSLLAQVVMVERSLLAISGPATEGTRVKIRRRMFFALFAASALSLTSIVVSAVAAETPFKGTVSAVETVVVAFPTASLTRDGTGTATYLGKYTVRIVMTINLPTLSSTGTATFTAANGDTLTANVAGQATRTGPTTLSIIEDYTITGGTGRFADATGSVTLESTVEQTTGVSSGTYSGVIDH